MSQDRRKPVRVRRIDECHSVHEIFEHCLPAFGGAILRRVYTILDRAMAAGCPLTISIAGPITVSGQHQAWLIPLLETGYVAYLSTTDAVCYHDGHRSLNEHSVDPIYEVPIFGDDGQLRDEGVIRVTDMGFDEAVLLDQDKFLAAMLTRPEFQKKMTGTELRYKLGAHYAAQEKATGVQPGLLSVLDAKSKLGRNHHVIANRAEGLPDELFIHERPVGFGGVKERDAPVNGCADDREAFFAARGRAVAETDPHATESERRYFQSAFAQGALLHGSVLL